MRSASSQETTRLCKNPQRQSFFGYLWLWLRFWNKLSTRKKLLGTTLQPHIRNIDVNVTLGLNLVRYTNIKFRDPEFKPNRLINSWRTKVFWVHFILSSAQHKLFKVSFTISQKIMMNATKNSCRRLSNSFRLTVQDHRGVQDQMHHKTTFVFF